MEPTPRAIYEFGPFRLDPNRHELLQSGQPVALPPKAFEILIALLQNRDALLSKTELLDRVWPGTFVEENNLAQHVSLLRKILGEHHLKPRYIETVPRMGYRFVGEVRLVENGQAAAGETAAQGGVPSPLEALRARNQPPLGPKARPHWISVPALGWSGVTLAVLLAFLFWPKPDPAVLDYFQLTHDRYPKHGPLLTDGEFVYFTESREGVNTLVRVPGAGGEPVVLPGLPAVMEPVDLSRVRHEMLALEQGTTGGEMPVWAWALPAGPWRRLGDLAASAVAWSPHGDHIFYARNRELYRAKSDGSESAQLVTTPGRASSLRVSPDGRLLAFSVQREKGTTDELWETRVDGTQLRRISSGGSPEIARSKGMWTQNARYFVFPETGEGRNWFWALKRPLHGFGGETRKRLSTGLLSVTDLIAGGDGGRIFAIGALDRVEIVRYDANPGGLSSYLPGVSADGLAFSRQGDWVAYVSYPDRRLVRSRPDGSDARELTAGSLTALLPAWSPDGTRIAYMARTGSSPWKIRLTSRDGGASEELLPGNEDEGNPTWSPDGNSLICAGVPWVKGFTPNSTAIRQVDLAHRNVVTLPRSTGLWSPRWSPNGKYLVAETIDSQRLVLFEFSAKTWTPLANTQGETIGYTSWSHDSRYLYYNTYVHQRGSIYRVDVSGGTTARIPTPDGLGHAVTLGQWFTLAPDDTPLLLRDISAHEIFSLDLRLP